MLLSCIVPGTIGNLEARETSNGITVSWRPPGERNGRITAYVVQYEVNKHITREEILPSRFTIINLPIGSVIENLKVSAINEVGVGPPLYYEKKLIFGV